MRTHRHITATVGLLTMVFALVAGARDWTQFRGPGAQGVSTATGLPVNWSDTEGVAWRTTLPGAGSSSPICLDGKLYVTTYDGYGIPGQPAGDMNHLKLHVVCLSAADGRILWDREIDPILPEQKKIRDHGYAGPTPVTDGDALYVYLGKTGVLKLDLNGKVLWQTSVGTRLHGWGCGTSPVLYKDLVIVNASVESGSLVALSKRTGKEVWRAGGMKSSWNTPVLAPAPGGKQELVVSVHSLVLGFDPETGKELWRCSSTPDYICPSIVSKGMVVYAIGGRRSQTHAIKTGGRGDVTNSHKLWVAEVGANVSSPVIVGDHLYWVSDRNTTAYCLKLSDGSMVYSEKFPAQPYASTLAADGKLYVVTRRGGTIVLPAEPRFEILARNRFENDRGQFNASPIIAEGRLILRSDSALYCIGKP